MDWRIPDQELGKGTQRAPRSRTKKEDSEGSQTRKQERGPRGHLGLELAKGTRGFLDLRTNQGFSQYLLDSNQPFRMSRVPILNRKL